MNCWAMERAVRSYVIVIPCLCNKGRILSTNDVSLPRTFSMVCLILATCAWICFRFCDSISGFACFRYHLTAAFVLQKKYDHFLAFNLIALFLYKFLQDHMFLFFTCNSPKKIQWNDMKHTFRANTSDIRIYSRENSIFKQY